MWTILETILFGILLLYLAVSNENAKLFLLIVEFPAHVIEFSPSCRKKKNDPMTANSYLNKKKDRSENLSSVADVEK